MDSLSQIALGACVAAACVPKPQRRKALLAGAMLGTLPDLDVVIDYGGAVENFTMHRGFSHSLFVLTAAGVAIWSLLRWCWTPVREAPRAWFAAILLTLLTHTLLDAHTAYGTQLWWPFEPSPASWATLFIIDPLYTLPLLIAAIVVLAGPSWRWTGRVLAAGLVSSSAYLAWSWVARDIVMRNVRESLANANLEDAPVFVTPTPFNTLLWRVVVLDEQGHLEGFDSLVADDGPIVFTRHGSDVEALAQASGVPSVDRLVWFANGFVSASLVGDELVLADLRMGQEPDYVFRHAVATRGNPHWHAIDSRRLPANMNMDRIRGVWDRIWSAP